MSKQTKVTVYYVGRTPQEALGYDDPVFDEKFAQELAEDVNNIYAIDLTVFASRLKKVEKWSTTTSQSQ